jgi:hypothetical protein
LHTLNQNNSSARGLTYLNTSKLKISYFYFLPKLLKIQVGNLMKSQSQSQSQSRC